MRQTTRTSRARVVETLVPFAAATGTGATTRTTAADDTSLKSDYRERRLLPLVRAYAPVPALGALLSIAWDVGASPTGGAEDLLFRGTALAPPLFLPVALAGAAAAARRPGATGAVGVAVCALVGAAFLGGSTLNLPNDLAAAAAAGTPVPLTIALAIVHSVLAIALLWHAVPALLARLRR
jgi:hypothetical protein